MQVDPGAELLGAQTVELVCTLGLPCSVVVPGHRREVSNHVVVLVAGSTCGDPAAELAPEFGTAPAQVAGAAMVDLFGSARPGSMSAVEVSDNFHVPRRCEFA